MHVITDLDVGGAEVMLTRVLPKLAPYQVTSEVVCLSDGGPLVETLRAGGSNVICLNMRPGRFSFSALARLIGCVDAFQPDLIHSWLYHADFLASLAAIWTRVPIYWSLHNSEFSPEAKASTRIVVRALAFLSGRLPRKILSCSRTAAALHVQRGYRADKIAFVPNGFDTAVFAPDAEKRKRFREAHGISESDLIIGNVARFDPQKNHQGLIRAFRDAAADRPDVRLLLAGRRMDAGNDVLMGWVREAGIESRLILLGEQRDVTAIMNGIDIFVLPSISEAFPLALGEAMSCGCYCIATDVGDCAELVQYGGEIVRDGEKLSEALRRALALPAKERAAVETTARTRIRNFYSIDRMVSRLDELYRAE